MSSALKAALLDLLLTLAAVAWNRDQRRYDFASYVAQASQVLHGEFDYSKIRGPLGAVAYPAGHCYFYIFFNWVTNGSRIVESTILMALVHAFYTYILVAIYEESAKRNKSRVTLAIAMVLLQFREREYFVQCLQNDSVMQLFLVVAVFFIQRSKVILSLFFFNLALSIKQGPLFWLPGYLFVLAQCNGILAPVVALAFTTIFQFALALPFIAANSQAYFNVAFGLGRRLEPHKTIAYYWLSHETFYSQATVWAALGLMMGWHLLFLFTRWTQWKTFLREIRLYPFTVSKLYPDPEQSLLILFTSALISFMFSWNHQPQFYSWAAPVYPFLIDKCDNWPPFVKLSALVVIDFRFRDLGGASCYEPVLWETIRHACLIAHCAILLTLYKRGLKSKSVLLRTKTE